MAFSQASVKYKPLRIGFLVRQGQIEDLVTAAQINTLIWGGIYNPLLPISDDENELSAQLIDLFSIDVLFATTESPEVTAFRERYPYLRDSSRNASNLFVKEWQSSKNILGVLDVKNLIDLLWREDFKNRPKGFSKRLLYSRVEP